MKEISAGIIAYFFDEEKFSFEEENDVFKIDNRANKIAENFNKKLAYWEFI